MFFHQNVFSIKPLISLPNNSTPLFSAVARNDLKDVEELLKDTSNSSLLDQVVILEEENLDKDSKHFDRGSVVLKPEYIYAVYFDFFCVFQVFELFQKKKK